MFDLMDQEVQDRAVNVTRGRSYVWKPGGDIMIDPLSRGM